MGFIVWLAPSARIASACSSPRGSSARSVILLTQPFTFSGKGTLINVSRQLLPPTRIMGFREDAIRIMVGVKLEEGPVVMSELVDCLDDVDKLIGKPVHHVIRKLARSANGDYKYGYKFKLSRQLSEPAL